MSASKLELVFVPELLRNNETTVSIEGSGVRVLNVIARNYARGQVVPVLVLCVDDPDDNNLIELRVKNVPNGGLVDSDDMYIGSVDCTSLETGSVGLHLFLSDITCAEKEAGFISRLFRGISPLYNGMKPLYY